MKLHQLRHIIDAYWKKTRIDLKWHVFIRKFWENPDYNESDLSVAYRRRTQNDTRRLRPPKLEQYRQKL